VSKILDSDESKRLAARLATVDPVAVGARIRASRNQAKLSQAALGKLIGSLVQSISGWELGGGLPTLEKLADVARFCDVDVIWLITGLAAEVDEQATIEARVAPPVRRFGRPWETERSGPLVATPGRRVPLVLDATAWGASLAESDLATALKGAGAVGHANQPCSAESFALRIPNEANAPALGVADIVIVDPAVRADPGDLVVARIGSEIVIGRLRRGPAGPELVHSQDWGVTTIPEENAALIGPVVEVSKALKRR